MIAGRVHGCDPPVRSLLLHLGKLVVPFGLKDQMSGAIAGETDDEVGLEIVRLAVVEIRDRKAEARNFNEGVNGGICVDQVGRRLLPLPGVSDCEIQVRTHDLAHVATRPEIDHSGGAIVNRHGSFRE
jgi:hypothetical protein